MIADLPTVIYIDGANAAQAQNAAGWRMDWRKFRQTFEQQCELIRSKYYTALLADSRGDVAIQPLVDWLETNRYKVITKQAKRQTAPNGEKIIKGNMDIEIAVDMMRDAKYAKQMILFTGDDDFVSVVQAVQDMGVKVIVISIREGPSRVLGDGLYRQADAYIDMNLMRDTWRNEKYVEAIKGGVQSSGVQSSENT